MIIITMMVIKMMMVTVKNIDDDDAPIKTFPVAEQMYARAALSLSSHSEQQ